MLIAASRSPAVNDRLAAALAALRDLDRSLSPLALSRARETALVEGLHGLAGEYGRELAPTRIDARGELHFAVLGDRPPACARYGDELAGWLNRIPVRTGLAPVQGHVLPENGWCFINHFDAERLLGEVAAELGDGPAAPRP
jgi:hypothetical protein